MKNRDNGGHREKTITGQHVEINMKYATKHNMKYGTAYLDAVEQREAIASVGDSATMLLQYLLEIASHKKEKKYPITDIGCAKHFGWQLAKAQRLRRDLEKAGYFLTKRFYSNTGEKAISYYIGKETVGAAECK
jgi:hypothetical protein